MTDRCRARFSDALTIARMRRLQLGAVVFGYFKKGNKINKLAMAVVLVVGVTAGGMAQAQSTLKPKQQKEECENGCNNRTEVPKTRSLKPKSQKECADENTCADRPVAPKTRGLKQKKGKECASSNDYCG